MAAERLLDEDELLHRQFFVGDVDDGRVQLDAFVPRPKDKGRLSVSPEHVVGDAEAAWEEWNGRGYRTTSTGVASVSVGEVHSAGTTASQDSDSHAYITFEGVEEPKWEAIAFELARHANNRGLFIAK